MMAGLEQGSVTDAAVSAYYRCPDQFATFQVFETLGSDVGFFRFGPDLVCYGRSSGGQCRDVEASISCDAMHHVSVEHSGVSLPFQPFEVAENLRRERYLPGSRPHETRPAGWKALQRTIYYLLRPYLGVAARKYLQRAALSGWSKRQFPSWPVDRSVDLLFERLLLLSMKAQGVDEVPFIWFWPDGHKSCAIMTHDVEGPSGVEFCSSLMDIDSSFGIKSSFQFVPEERYSCSPAFLDTLKARGFEVNVHDLNHDGHLYDDRDQFLRRAQRINHYVKQYGANGFRSGVLYRNPDWYDAFEFSYDLSVPNVGHLDPQPGGCCTTTPFFIGDILEIPLTTIQDYSLFHVLSDYSIAVWRRQVEYIIANYGLVSINVHPDYLLEPAARQTYTTLLEYLSSLRSEARLQIVLPGEINAWWRTRQSLRIVRDRNRWSIVGRGSERARLAYARRQGEAISYHL